MRAKRAKSASRGASLGRELPGQNRERLIVVEEVVKALQRSVDAQSRRMDREEERANVLAAKVLELRTQFDRLILASVTFVLAFITRGSGEGILKALSVALKVG